MSKEIQVQHVGPVSDITIPLDPEGGVTVLRAENGAGKTILIDAVSKLLGGKQVVGCQDDEARGVIEGLGARISVAKSSRRSGECQAVSLTGKFDPSDIIDPGLRDADAADRARIKALLAIHGVAGDASLFYDLVGGKASFEAVVSKKAAEAGDLVEMARLVKSSLEERARGLSDQAKHEEGHAEALRQSAEGMPDAEPLPVEQLQAKLEEALKAHSAADTKRGTAFMARNAAAEAQQEMEANAQELNVAELEATFDAADAALCEASEGVSAAKAALTGAERELAMARDRAKAAAEQFTAAKKHEAAIEGWRRTIDKAASVGDITDEELAALSEAVTQARAAIEEGALLRKAAQDRVKAKEHAEEASSLRSDSERVRDAAKSTDVVLSDAVKSEQVRIEGGRLVVDHPKRGKTLYHELSHGERATIAVLEAVKRIRDLGLEEIALIPIQQQIWEGIDPANREAIWKLCREQKVNILTAECSSGDLRAEEFSPEGEVR